VVQINRTSERFASLPALEGIGFCPALLASAKSAGGWQIADFIQQQCAASARRSAPPRRLRRARFVRLLAKSADSNVSGAVSRQETATKRLSRRALAAWIARARSSFPVPFSPVISAARRCLRLIGNRQAVFHELTARYEVRAPVNPRSAQKVEAAVALCTCPRALPCRPV